MTRKVITALTAVVALASLSLAVAAKHHLVGQLDKAFSTESLTIKVGDSVEFRNDDEFFHNVFSLSGPKTFDLGSYPQGESKSITFDQAGEVEVECAIHPSMYMTINVEE